MFPASRWLPHTRNTEPAEYGRQIEALPGDLRSLCSIVQSLLIHLEAFPLYGVDPSSFGHLSRTTLPVRERLRRLTGRGRPDIREGRAPGQREVGTCRDFALFLCSFLRTHGTPARVRCGFASYLGQHWEDHWICEHWDPERQGWFRADAQLDSVMLRAHAIAFDPTDMPEGAFLTAGEAWLACRAGRLSFDSFGHGEQRGTWFASVDVARDHLSLMGREMSDWDGWRGAPPDLRHVSRDEMLDFDELAHDPEGLIGATDPPWLAAAARPRSSG